MNKASELAKLKLVLREAGFFEYDGVWKQSRNKTREDGVEEGRKAGRREVAELALTVWGLRDRYPDVSEDVTVWRPGACGLLEEYSRPVTRFGSVQFLADLEAAANLADAEGARERIFGNVEEK